MKRKKRTSITVETTRVLIVSGARGQLNWCPKCGAEVSMLTVDEAVDVARANVCEILRKMEDQRLHFIQAPDESLLICPNSLLG